MTEWRFLSLEAVLALHAGQLSVFGGGDGLRDQGLLESALAQPMATFSDEFLHGDLVEMAAAYLFHIVQNHPFVDGNKRTGLLSAIVFLAANGVTTRVTPVLYDITMAVAEGQLGKSALAEQLRGLVDQPAAAAQRGHADAMPTPELFYVIADPACAAARKAVMDRGLKKRVNFRNLTYPEVTSDFEARGGRELPALWDGATLHQGLAAVLAALDRVPLD